MFRWVNVRTVSALLSLLLLAGVAAERASLAPPADAEPYLHRVVEASASIPMHFGEWSGEEVPEPYDVVKMLRPNLLTTRRYQSGGRKFWVVIVQCSDTRTLAGHYPPICYVDVGYSMISSTPTDWSLDDLTVTGTEYIFATDALDPKTSIVVDNFMVLPDGQFARDMEPLYINASTLRGLGFGAAEVQFMFEPGFDLAERSKIVTEFLTSCRPLISAIRSGPEHL